MKGKFSTMAIGLLAGMTALCTPLQGDDCCYCECDNFWFDADYLYWQIQDSPEPVVLVTSGTSASSLNLSSTSSNVLGGRSIKNDWRSGGRFALGYWFDQDRCFGLEANYFFLPSESKSGAVASTGAPDSLLLGVPYFDVATGFNAESAWVFAEPDVYTGFAGYKLRNSMQNAELNALTTYSCGCDMNVSFLAGFRYWNFDENFKFYTSSPAFGNSTDIYQTVDKFDVQNNFYGGQVGIAFDYNCDCFFFNVKGKLALGGNCGRIGIHGEFLTNQTDGTTIEEFEGGIFAQPTNIGNHSSSVFTVIPEVNANIGYWFTDCLSVHVGYNFLYVNNVYWAGKQIDRDINPTQKAVRKAVLSSTGSSTLVGVDAPRAKNRTASLWTQGVNAGIEFKF